MREAARLAPSNAEYQFQLGKAAGAANKLDEALAAFKECVRLDPGFARAWYNLALVHDHANRTDDAIAAYRHAERLNPLDPDIPYAAATLYERIHRFKDAREAAAAARGAKFNRITSRRWNCFGNCRGKSEGDAAWSVDAFQVYRTHLDTPGKPGG